MLDYKNFFTLEPFGLGQKDKENWYFKNQKKLSKYHYKNCKEYKKISDRIFKDISTCKNLSELPFVHTKIFKEFNLRSVKINSLSKTLTSSGTSNQITSQINIDRKTSLLQSKALLNIFSNLIKEKVTIFFVENPSTLAGATSLSARGAAIRGFSQLSKNSVYLLDKNNNLKIEKLLKFLKKNPDEKFIIFGFTSLVWFFLIEKMKENKIKIKKNNGILIHGGGWKKLKDKSVSRNIFNHNISKNLGIKNIHNYYGMVEQTGSVFLECELGYFHTSIFSDVYIRDHNLNLAKNRNQGLIQAMSLLPLSYPGHNILTDDIGVVMGVDNCKCGRKGKFFSVIGRVPGTEKRGCSDVY